MHYVVYVFYMDVKYAKRYDNVLKFAAPISKCFRRPCIINLSAVLDWSTVGVRFDFVERYYVLTLIGVCFDFSLGVRYGERYVLTVSPRNRYKTCEL